MHFTKDVPKTEAEIFADLFKGKSKNWSSDQQGNLTEVHTEDKEIIKWLKEHNFNEND